MLSRALTSRIEQALGLFPVVVVTGSRQTGKSTLVREAEPFAGRPYVTLDTALNREIAVAEPGTFLGNHPGVVTIDEVQRVPELLLSIKERVDAERVNGRFLLTGSANLLLLHTVSESLAGRARYLTLWPMTRREQLGLARCGIWSELLERPAADWPTLIAEQTVPAEAWQTLASRGGYPAPALLNPTQAADPDRAELFAGYAQTYLERDLRDLAAVDSLVDFQRLMRAVCLRLGAIVNQADIARDTGIPRTTVQRYLNLLEVSYQLVRLEPYSVNRSKRLVKSPKVYWSDTGLALHLSGAQPTGAHLENIVCTDLLAWRELDTARPSILFWRTAAGDEVDFLIERNGKLLAIEVKATTNPGYNDSKGLRLFLEEYGTDALGGLLLHGGEETFWISERVLATPWWKVI
ncbi:MAG TPA: ATP-binding protein [Povalibacter sp.]|uniref:ATP-binding protein n=1 Tax=Povalibacter sp. TaxID=1962978 RepID=UPI002B88EF1C|nr:ATP-binding protein [Povalibacter sp.]HMN44182.1 ATP-binding protein [Povalibacter sp.]